MTRFLAGLHECSAADYHADPCDAPSLSSSVAKILLDQSPLHAFMAHPRLNPDHEPDQRDDYDIGTACHALVLEGEDSIVIVDAEDWRTKVAKQQRDAARADGRIALLRKHYNDVLRMAVALHEEVVASEPPSVLSMKHGVPEQCLIWQERNGIWCRARPDWLRNDHRLIADYKTTTNAAPDAWIRSQLFGLGYDIQAAFYLRGLRAVFGHDAAWRWVVQETKPPYAVSIIAPTPAVLALADKKVERAIAIWGECLKAGLWPGYGTRVAWADLPTWQEQKWLDRELRDEQEQQLNPMAAG